MITYIRIPRLVISISNLECTIHYTEKKNKWCNIGKLHARGNNRRKPHLKNYVHNEKAQRTTGIHTLVYVKYIESLSRLINFV